MRGKREKAWKKGEKGKEVDREVREWSKRGGQRPLLHNFRTTFTLICKHSELASRLQLLCNDS